MAAAGALPAVRLRSGTVGRTASRARRSRGVTPGRAVVCVSLASGRSWMVLPASRAHRASGVAKAVRRERRRRTFQGAGVDRTGSETFSEHMVVTETRI
jgi:hypothetical protein